MSDKSRQTNHLQRIALNADLHRSATDVFAICIQIQRMFGLDPQTGSGKIVDLADGQMPAEVNRREHTEKFERIDGADYADVEQAIVHLGARRDFHASAVSGSVGEGSEDSGLGFLNFPAGCRAGMFGRVWLVRRNARSLHSSSRSLRE